MFSHSRSPAQIPGRFGVRVSVLGDCCRNCLILPGRKPWHFATTRLGPGTGLWHRMPAGAETLRVHRRFFKDIETADASTSAAAA